jgi:hypothetical protein
LSETELSETLSVQSPACLPYTSLLSHRFLKKNKKVPKGNLEWQDFFCAMFVFFLINERILGLSFVGFERSQNISDKIESSFSKDIYAFAFNFKAGARSEFKCGALTIGK